MLVISSREFRENQKAYFDQIDAGQEILVQRGKNKSYKIVPVTELDTIIGKEYVLEPDADFERAITIEELLQGVKEDIHEMFKNKKEQ